MDQGSVIIFKSLLLPPGGLILLGLFGLLFSHKLFGKLVLTLTLVLFYLLSTPFVATNLIFNLERHVFQTPKEIKQSGAEAILVLAGGRYEEAPEYGGDTIKGFSLERARYAAWLHRETGLPIIVSGGDVAARGQSEASLLKEVLKTEYGSKILATEDKSKNTWENILFTERLLKQNKIQKVALVTHAWHMPRALKLFANSRVQAIAAPTIFTKGRLAANKSQMSDWLPNSRAFRSSYLALHEQLGMAWYRIKDEAGLN